MSAMSDYLETSLFNAVLRGVAFTSPSSIYVALFTTDPTDAGTGTEVSAASYVRLAATFAVPSNGSAANNADLIFPTATTNWGTITHVGVYDALTSGNLLFHGVLSASKVIDAGDVFKFAAGALIITFQ